MFILVSECVDVAEFFLCECWSLNVWSFSSYSLIIFYLLTVYLFTLSILYEIQHMKNFALLGSLLLFGQRWILLGFLCSVDPLYSRVRNELCECISSSILFSDSLRNETVIRVFGWYVWEVLSRYKTGSNSVAIMYSRQFCGEMLSCDDLSYWNEATMLVGNQLRLETTNDNFGFLNASGLTDSLVVFSRDIDSDSEFLS